MRFFLITISIFLVSNVNAQNQSKYKEFRNYDYFSHQYKYLTKNFKIEITNDKFQSLIAEYQFIPDRIVSYKDSLAVVICPEFDSWAQVNIAVNRIGFSWLRVGYYLWLNEREAEKLGAKYGFNHPYKLYDYCYTNNENNWDDYLKNFMNQLRVKVRLQTNNPDVSEMNVKKFLSYSLKNNPERIRKFEELKTQINSKDNCKKENCCQSKDSNKEPCDSITISD